eukprot:CAMPEP_0179324194 /NCGR_PEP_ID=MMETSP0797-20121207/60147_1 /TAXON_ID=47934 /ORGANISM="Dinophysis acuminata, Strain DAEP01" /LENGTH=67 /DNA_ID=CAMNT_0021036133 /DNA_START=44 /DNA_END=248 /DNA_ORIENTATION=+
MHAMHEHGDNSVPIQMAAAEQVGGRPLDSGSGCGTTSCGCRDPQLMPPSPGARPTDGAANAAALRGN